MVIYHQLDMIKTISQLRIIKVKMVLPGIICRMKQKQIKSIIGFEIKMNKILAAYKLSQEHSENEKIRLSVN